MLLVLLLTPALALAQPPVLNAYAAPRDPTILTSTFVDWDSLNPRTTAVGQSRPVFDNPTQTLEKLEVHITTLLPGMASHPIHHHAWEEMLLLKEGQLDASINGRKLHAGPGSLLFFASHDPHNVTNTGATPATYYVINFVTGLSLAASGRPAVQQAVPGKLASGVYDCGAQPITPTPTGSRSVCLSSPTLTFLALESHITTLNPGQSTAKDILDANDEIVILKTGTVEITVNGVASRMQAGSMLYWAPNVKRTLRNLGTTPASYQVFRVTTAKSPRPASGN